MGESAPVVEPGARRRADILFFAFVALLGLLVVRLYGLQVRDHDGYAADKDAQSRAHVLIQEPRGGIYDSEGRLLAISVPVASVWADPTAIEDFDGTARRLAALLSLPVEHVAHRLGEAGLQFVWIKRRVSEEEADAVRRLADAEIADRKARHPKTKVKPPFGLVTEFDRKYLFGPLAAHILGHESGDPRKHEGVERTMDRWLAGRSQPVEVTVDGLRRLFETPDWELSGAEVTLTIDILFQKIVEEELDAAVAEFHPKWAACVAMDPRTGEILAIANRPTFDPNEPGRAAPDARRNRAVTDPYEPGSTFKPFMVAAALEEHLLTPETRIEGENGLWNLGNGIHLRDHNPYGVLTVKEGVSKSSNIVCSKIGALFLGRQRMYDWIRAFGFGKTTEIELPAESGGVLHPLRSWTAYSNSRVPIGQEISVTPLQLVTGMCALANGGWLMQPYVVSRVRGNDGTLLHEGRPTRLRRLLSDETVAKMNDILRDVMVNGTGKHVEKIDGLTLAGKTGTTQLIDRHGILYGYVSSFVAFAPAEDAHIVIAVVIDRPQGTKYYGAAVAAPVVARILKRGMVFVR